MSDNKQRERAYTLKIELRKQLARLEEKKEKLIEDIDTTHFLLGMIDDKEKELATAQR